MRRSATTAASAAALALAVAAGCTTVKEDDPAAVDAGASTTAPSLPPTDPGATTPTTPPPPPAVDVNAVTIQLEEIVELDQPTAMAVRSGDPALYIAQQGGVIRRVEIETDRRTRRQEFTLERQAVLDISDDVINDGERGLLGLTFSTDGNHLYVAYTGTDDRQHLDEYEMGTDRVSGGSRRELLVIDDFAPNHNGGNITFGPDGFLYWGMGDGGGAGDPAGTGQNPGDLLGSLLRIDPDVAPEERDAGATYSIPDGNPFRNGGGAPEVWAYGLRNPWRFSFDRATGDLWIADVGQGEIEEIDFLPATGGTGAGRGANLGWSSVEGNNPFNEGTAPEGAIAPIFGYDHDGGRCSVTGGYVYRGAAIPALVGIYVFADFCGGELRGVIRQVSGDISEGPLDHVVSFPSSFGQDSDGELYVLSLSGPVYRIVPG
jgi:glucose/arabinose dehydrogenase